MTVLLEKEKQEKIEQYNQETGRIIADQLVLKASYQAQVDEIKKELDEFSEKRLAINEAIRRERELEEAEDFYRIDVPQEDQEDIEVLKCFF